MPGSRSFPSFAKLFLALFAFCALIYLSRAHSERYYDMVQSLINERDYYTILEVPRNADPKDIRKSFLKKMMKYHPDKNKDPSAVALYLEATEANDILSDPELRAEYDALLERGVSLEERYYGRFMHKMRVPQHKLSHVLLGLSIIATLLHIYLKYQKYTLYQERAKRSRAYIQAMKKRQESLNANKANADEEEDDENDPPEIGVKVYGAEKPTWRDLLPVQAAFLIPKIWHYLTTSAEQRKKEREEKLRKEFLEYLDQIGMTEAEYEAYVEREVAIMKARYERRMKRFQRWMKKRK